MIDSLDDLAAQFRHAAQEAMDEVVQSTQDVPGFVQIVAPDGEGEEAGIELR